MHFDGNSEQMQLTTVPFRSLCHFSMRVGQFGSFPKGKSLSQPLSYLNVFNRRGFDHLYVTEPPNIWRRWCSSTCTLVLKYREAGSRTSPLALYVHSLYHLSTVWTRPRCWLRRHYSLVLAAHERQTHSFLLCSSFFPLSIELISIRLLGRIHNYLLDKHIEDMSYNIDLKAETVNLPQFLKDS